MLTAPLMPLLNLGAASPANLQAANRNGPIVDPAQYSKYFRALQLQSAHERRRRSIVQHMLRNYQPAQLQQPIEAVVQQVPLEAQFRALYRYH